MRYAQRCPNGVECPYAHGAKEQLCPGWSSGVRALQVPWCGVCNLLPQVLWCVCNLLRALRTQESVTYYGRVALKKVYTRAFGNLLTMYARREGEIVTWVEAVA